MRLKTTFDIGFGLNITKDVGRIVSKSGDFNVAHKNRPFQFRDVYHYLINTSWIHFFFWILLGYFIICFFFAAIYFLVGIDGLSGIRDHDFWGQLLHCFYFSTQTFTTVGYGTISPSGHGISMISSLEALIGLLWFSFATGLLYGRFSRAEPNLKFSQYLYRREFRGEQVFMFRMMHKHPNVLIDLHAEVYLLVKMATDTGVELKYFPMRLERENLTLMPLTWTLVIQVDEDNPLKTWTESDFQKNGGEFIIVVRYFDETFSQVVYQRHSYLFEEIRFNYAFLPAYAYDHTGKAILNHEALDFVEEIVG